jgi:hypothetical protein
MLKEYKPGWDYIIMNNVRQKISPEVHLVKNGFGGEIVDFIHKENRNERF